MGKTSKSVKPHLEYSDKIKKEITDICSDFSSLTGIDFDSSFIYVNFLILGSQTVGSLAKELKIDRNKVYRIIDNLESYGFVSMTLSSPKICTPIDIKSALDLIIRKKEDEKIRIQKSKEKFLKKLESLSLSIMYQPQTTFRVIQGLSNIYSDIGKIIEKSNSVVFLVMQTEDVLKMYHTNVPEKIAQCKKNGNKVYLITNSKEDIVFPFLAEINPTEIRIGKPPSKGRMIVSKNKEMVMTESSPSNSFLDEDLDVSLYTNSKDMVENIFTLCTFLWEMSDPLPMK